MSSATHAAQEVNDGFQLGPAISVECEGDEITLQTYITDGDVTFDLEPPEQPVSLSHAQQLIDALRTMVAEFEGREHSN
ncbi:hypothetical protein [Isoptericola dokdonensis]|uniref:Uncharacterized protein n=1 Tax=Isoptericola dokdonensis DS-3 TaxID=1300344 RepID=A0A168FDQ4_9MICO|nr:hypothetical protein [Isoptericola dokdonensis]ANC31461.1 hypothetical protein I598_1913 [Isoptericola dokdonensis DS-3]